MTTTGLMDAVRAYRSWLKDKARMPVIGSSHYELACAKLDEFVYAHEAVQEKGERVRLEVFKSTHGTLAAFESPCKHPGAPYERVCIIEATLPARPEVPVVEGTVTP